jgi:hypothetical protein
MTNLCLYGIQITAIVQRPAELLLRERDGEGGRRSVISPMPESCLP